MEISPLVQQARPSFKTKISQLYEKLFIDEDDVSHSEGFWSEFFHLKPDKPSLHRRLEGLNADDLLHFQHETQQLFRYAVQYAKLGRAPSDEVALDTLTVFLGGVLAKRYTNPSSDIITVLAGLDEVDVIFSDFANAVESLIRTGRTLGVRKKAIEVALSLTSGAYQTSLVSYFTHRDLFPSLMKYVQDSDDSSQLSEPFILLGLLVNYNKFEYRNPYRLRLEDFVNESSILKILHGSRRACAESRDQYAAVLEDLPEVWNLSSALNYIGLGILAPIKAITPATASEDSKEQFANLPGPDAAVLLATYDFVKANKLFSYNLISCPAERKNLETPHSAFLSFTSYILHHAHRSDRATLYGLLNLSTIRIIIEDQVLCKRICSDESSIQVRLCRQRQPFLPLVSSPRPAACHILDITIDTLNHNLRRRLDIDLYIACMLLIHRNICCLLQNHIRLTYHWSLLWQSLLSLVRFLTIYSSDLTAQSSDIHTLLTPLIKIIALSVTSGNSFLPTPATYDDLIYKLVENSSILTRFQEAYILPSHHTTNPSEPDSSPIAILITVSAHYNDILEAEKQKGKMAKNLSPNEVSRIIRQGYETLEVPHAEGLEGWERWREEEERGFLKRVGRVAVEDARRLVRGL